MDSVTLMRQPSIPKRPVRSLAVEPGRRIESEGNELDAGIKALIPLLASLRELTLKLFAEVKSNPLTTDSLHQPPQWITNGLS